MRDVTRTPLLESYPLTSSTSFGFDGIGLDSVIDRSVSFVENVPVTAETRHALLLVYAIGGFGKSFYCQTLYRKLRRERGDTTVPICMTFNDHFVYNDMDVNVGVALATRMSFQFFVDHAAYGFTGAEDCDRKTRQDSAEEFRNNILPVLRTLGLFQSRAGFAKRVARAIDSATGNDKILALIVDETAQISNPEDRLELSRSVKEVADCLGTRQSDTNKTVGRVATVLTGISLASWRRAGFTGWLDRTTTSFRVLIWLELLGVDPALLLGYFEALISEKLVSLDLVEERLRNIATILCTLGSSHWRTYEDLATGVGGLSSTDFNGPDQALESSIIEAVSVSGRKFWTGGYVGAQAEAFAFLLAASNLYWPCFPQTEFPVASSDFSKTADWREYLQDLQPLKQPDARKPGDEAPFVPRFSLYAVQAQSAETYCGGYVPPILRAFSRHLYALLVTADMHNIHAGPFWERWEYDLANMLRLKLLSLYLTRAMRWRETTGNYKKWPTSKDLMSCASVDNTVLLSSESVDESERTVAFLQGFSVVGQLAGAKLLLSSISFWGQHWDASDGELWITERAIIDAYDKDKVLVNNAITSRSEIKTFFPKEVLEGVHVAGNWQGAEKLVLSHDPRPGDVLILGNSSTGFDVCLFVRWAARAGRPERNGLILVQAKFQYGETNETNPEKLNKSKLRRTITGCEKLRGTLFGRRLFKKRAKWLGGFDVTEEDVLIVLATHSPRELNSQYIEKTVQKNKCKFSIAFGRLDETPGSGISAFFGKTLASRASLRPAFVNPEKKGQ